MKALVKNADDTWTETQPDGFELHYDTSGDLAWMASPAGDRWTVLRDGGLTSAIEDPFNRRTTYGYDEGDNFRRLVDSSGRITTFARDENCNLSRIERPDNSMITLLYDDWLLRTYIDPEGHRTTYTHDQDRRVTSVETATGARTTFTYDDDEITDPAVRVTDPAGEVTTGEPIGRVDFRLSHGGIPAEAARSPTPIIRKARRVWPANRLGAGLSRSGCGSLLCRSPRHGQ